MRPERFMSSMTDKPVMGSIGGNALSSFSITIDFIHAKAYIRS